MRNQTQYFPKIRHAYEKLMPDIENAIKTGHRISPYVISEYGGFNWGNIFTPIEENVFSDIRYLGLPMHPQFPIRKYFVDFADPQKKLVIEVDGKHWHEDKNKDRERDKNLFLDGWDVLRIEGSKTYKSKNDFGCDTCNYLSIYRSDECSCWNDFITESSEGILFALYFGT